MDVTPEERQDLERVLSELESVDPADLPEPAARLAALLEAMLERPGEISP